MPVSGEIWIHSGGTHPSEHEHSSPDVAELIGAERLDQVVGGSKGEAFHHHVLLVVARDEHDRDLAQKIRGSHLPQESASISIRGRIERPIDIL